MDGPQSLLSLSISQIAVSFKKMYELRTKLDVIKKQLDKIKKLPTWNKQDLNKDANDGYCLKSLDLGSSIKQILDTELFSQSSFIKFSNNNYSKLKDMEYQLPLSSNVLKLDKNCEYDLYQSYMFKKLDALESNKFKNPDITDHEYGQMIYFITHQLAKIECFLINQFAYYHPGPIINDAILKTLDSHNFPNEYTEWFLTLLLNIPKFMYKKFKDLDEINSIKINKLILTNSKISQDLLKNILSEKKWIQDLTDFDIFKTIMPLSSFGNDNYPKSLINSPKGHCENLHPTKHLAYIFNHLQDTNGNKQKSKGFKVLNLGPLTTSDLLKVIQVTSMSLKATEGSWSKSSESSISKSNFYGLRALTISELINNSKNHSISSSSESENEDLKYTGITEVNTCTPNNGGGQEGKFKIKKFWQSIGNSTSSLVYLEIDNADYLHPREYSYIFRHLHNLTHLILYNSFSDDSIEPILKLTNLQYLDVSHSYAQTFPNKKFIMRSVMKHLPNLRALDISGTDLAGEICSTTKFGQKCEPYLTSLKKCKKRFEFLGLFNTPNNVSHCPNIPAETISGDANEDQILLSLEIYRLRPEALQKAITDLFLLFRYSIVKNSNRALENILSLAKDYKTDKNIVLTSSACLFYLFKTDFKRELNCRQTRFVISSVLGCMENFGDDQNVSKRESGLGGLTIIRNGLLTLFHFNIPDELVFAMDRTVRVLVCAMKTSIARQELLIGGRGAGERLDYDSQAFIFEDIGETNQTDDEDGFSLEGDSPILPDDFEVEIEASGNILEAPVRPNLIRVTTNAVDHLDELVLRLSVCALNGLVCAGDTDHKKDTGQALGAIPATLAVIKVRIGLELCDEVLEVAWSTLWNITDETPENCECFLREGGMELFMASLRKFPEKGELYRNMLGLLGNISEVPALRPWLMKDDYVQIFYELLYNYVDGIEIAYNSAGIISHLLSDGPEAWTIKLPRAQVLNRLPDTIHRWNIDSKRNINYRSLEPILRLLNVFETPQIQHWSVWALANLTKVYPQKYVELLEEENGIPLLNNILSDSRPYDKIKQLATSVLKNIDTYKKGKSKSFSRNSSFAMAENNPF